MELTTLIIMIVIGLPIAILATHVAGGGRRPSLQSDDETVSIFHQDFPEETIGRIIYSADSRSAFFLLADGRIGLVYCFGKRFLTRQLKPEDIISAEPKGEAGLKLLSRDFTWPTSTFSFSDASSRDLAMSWLTTNSRQGEDIAHERSSVL